MYNNRTTNINSTRNIRVNSKPTLTRNQEIKLQKAHKRYLKMLLKQKLMGLTLILLSIIVVHINLNSLDLESKDGSVLIFMVPLAFYLLFTKEIVIS